MGRWWCAAGGLGRRVLSSSSSAAAVASHARPLPPPVIPKSASFNAPFSMPCRRHHSLHAPLPRGLFHPAIASAFRPPVSSRPVSFCSNAYCFDADFFSPWMASRAVGASAAGAALRQEGEVARAAHTHQVQSQEIQDEGPLVIAQSSFLCPSHLLARAPRAADFFAPFARSMKFRFRTMNDGQIRRWRAGKRHNAHLKVH